MPIVNTKRFIPKGRPEFPIGKLKLLNTYIGSIGSCDLCLVSDIVNMAQEFYKDEEGWGWNVCDSCKEELEAEGVI